MRIDNHIQIFENRHLIIQPQKKLLSILLKYTNVQNSQLQALKGHQTTV